MKILFIYPNAGSQIGFNYGVSHISSLLKLSGHSVELIQLCEEISPLPDDAQFFETVKASNPDIVGFSTVTNQWNYTKKLAALARKACPEAKIVCGGAHATIAGEETAMSGLFDCVFVGECEETFRDYADCIAEGRDPKNISNGIYLDQGKAVSNPVRLLPDLSRLPMKDYSIFDFQKLIDAKHGWVGLMASRGCPFSCTYCFNHKMVQKYRRDLACSFKDLNYIRHFPVPQVMDEISFLLSSYKNIKMFIFDDDLFTYRQDYVAEFCSEYRKRFTQPFVVNGHVGFFDERRASDLASANCKIVKFGLESGSEKIRRQIMNRHMSNESIGDAISMVNSAGMHSSVFVMIGLPHENKDDLMATVKLLARSRPGRFRWTFFFPFPGTESHEIASKGNFIDFKKMDDLVNFTDESCLIFDEEQSLFLDKVGAILPWFVNAESEMDCSPFYRKKVSDIIALTRREWEQRKPLLRDEDRQISSKMGAMGLSHYAVKYNRFMGVISDFFLNERD